MLNWVWIFSWGQQTNHSYGSHCQGYHNYNAKIKAKSQNLNLQQRMVPHHTKNVKPFFIIFYSYIFQEEFCLMRQNRLSIGRYDLHLKLKYIMNQIKMKRKSVCLVCLPQNHTFLPSLTIIMTFLNLIKGLNLVAPPVWSQSTPAPADSFDLKCGGCGSVGDLFFSALAINRKGFGRLK